MRLKFVNNGGINWTWLLCYEEVKDGVRVLFNDRWHNSEVWPDWVNLAVELAQERWSCEMGESDGRVLTRLEFAEYAFVPSSRGGVTYKFKGKRVVAVTNPQYVFDYRVGLAGGFEAKAYLEGPEFARDILYDAVGHLGDLFNKNEFTDGDQLACDLMGEKFQTLVKKENKK